MPVIFDFGGAGASEGNAQAADVLKGKTFSNSDDSGLVGSMPDNGDISGSVGVGGTFTKDANGRVGKINVKGPVLDGNAGTDDVLAQKTFYSNSGTKQTGKMPNNGAWKANVAAGSSVTIPRGFHDGTGKVTGTGEAAGAYDSGRDQGHKDVKNDPGSYGLEAGGSWQNGYNSGRAQGQTDVKNSPSSYGLEAGGSYNNGYTAGKAQPKSGSHRVSVRFTTGGGWRIRVSIDGNQVGDHDADYGDHTYTDNFTVTN